MGEPIMKMNITQAKIRILLNDLLSIPFILAVALVARVTAALIVEYLAQNRGAICLFGDSSIYWQYGQKIAHHTTYVVYQWDVPYYSLRTPGYPAWLAGFMFLFGELTWPVRLGQSALGTLSIYWLYQLSLECGFSTTSARYACILAALDPFQILNGSFILTEAVFTPVLIFFLLIWIRIWNRLKTIETKFTALFSLGFLGFLQGLLALIRPAWGPFLPILMMLQWIWFTNQKKKGFSGIPTILVPTLILLGWATIMMPWGLRNLSRIGRPALGGTWGGASLYDAVRPGADGSSDMSFVAEPENRKRSETEQDDYWKAISYRSIQENPVRILALAGQKLSLFWSPWPHQSMKRSETVRVISGVIVIPIWILSFLGMIRLGKTRKVSLILFLPLLFTMTEHMIFVGSMRYRIAVFLPVFVFAGSGLEWMITQLKKNQDFYSAKS